MNNFTNTSSLVPALRAATHATFHKSIVIWVAITLTLTVFGVAANAVILIATVKHPPLRRFSSCILLAHCVLIDLLTCIFLEPLVILTPYLGGFVAFPSNYCRIAGGPIMGSLFLTTWSHAVLAVSRFLAAVFPHQYRHFTRRPVQIAAIFLPWIIAVTLNAFPIAEWGIRYELGGVWAGCLLGTAADPLRGIIFILGVYIPCAVIGLSYAIVLIKVKLTVRRVVGDSPGGAGNPSRRSALRRRYEVAKLLFLCFIWFCIGNFGVSTAGTYFSKAYAASPLTQLALKGLQYLSPSFNPIFFILVSRDYRTGIRAVFGLAYRQRPHEISSRPTKQRANSEVETGTL
ncbi:hypothetical protein BV898_14770 [Hypsibius exemplaris]|uniref:G-protein coupled receptors family 1 profile domain-containing protein n=1 Tax=Hypsibius exemplaris TaxID=2072580 RepID=A0A9X6N9H4_HYPEX|nr:hypothetical protein BV898_14770 [Hypsibius exemplaris]